MGPVDHTSRIAPTSAISPLGRFEERADEPYILRLPRPGPRHGRFMSWSRPIRCALLLGIASVMPSCSHRAPAQPAAGKDTLLLDQSSFRMILPVDRGGTIHLSDQAPFQGRLDASPILRKERSRVETLQVMLHLGRLYIMGEGFDHLWEVSPVGGTRTA